MNTEVKTAKAWIVAAAVVATVAIFAATLFACAERERRHRAAPYNPVGIGIVAFTAVMVVLTVAMLPKEKRSVGRVAAIVGIEAVAFSYSLMFLLLNIYGS